MIAWELCLLFVSARAFQLSFLENIDSCFIPAFIFIHKIWEGNFSFGNRIIFTKTSCYLIWDLLQDHLRKMILNTLFEIFILDSFIINLFYFFAFHVNYFKHPVYSIRKILKSFCILKLTLIFLDKFTKFLKRRSRFWSYMRKSFLNFRETKEMAL